jgi:hypothetical protein
MNELSAYDPKAAHLCSRYFFGAFQLCSGGQVFHLPTQKTELFLSILDLKHNPQPPEKQDRAEKRRLRREAACAPTGSDCGARTNKGPIDPQTEKEEKNVP